jgi:DNA-binding NarL/FixJ family response regulator
MVASQLLYSKGSQGIVDLIVTDIRMPGPSGLWALATLRHLDWVTPVLVITAYDNAKTRAEAARLGAAGILVKPIDLDLFRAAVADLAGPALPSTPASGGADGILPMA